MNRLGNRKFRVIFLSLAIIFMIGAVIFSIIFIAGELGLVTGSKVDSNAQSAHFDIKGFESLQKK